MTRFRSLMASGLMVALLATTAAFAQAPGVGSGPGRGGRIGGLGPGGPGGPAFALPVRELNLTDAQRQQIRELTEQRREEGKALQERLEAARTAQRKAVEAVPVDEGAIRAAMAQLADVETEAAIANAHLRADIYALLTAEQKATLTKLQAAREQQVAQRRGR